MDEKGQRFADVVRQAAAPLLSTLDPEVNRKQIISPTFAQENLQTEPAGTGEEIDP